MSLSIVISVWKKMVKLVDVRGTEVGRYVENRRAGGWVGVEKLLFLLFSFNQNTFCFSRLAAICEKFFPLRYDLVFCS